MSNIVGATCSEYLIYIFGFNFIQLLGISYFGIVQCYTIIINIYFLHFLLIFAAKKSAHDFKQERGNWCYWWWSVGLSYSCVSCICYAVNEEKDQKILSG